MTFWTGTTGICMAYGVEIYGAQESILMTIIWFYICCMEICIALDIPQLRSLI
jgi:hypothetical protein